MNKEYYTKLIVKQINYLIEEKESLCGEITEIATYFDDREKDISLDRLDIGAINDKRQQIAAIYKLIEELEYLKKYAEDRW